MSDACTIKTKYKALSGRLDESSLRMWAATEANSLGRGGISTVAKALRISRTTIHTGLAESNKATALQSGVPAVTKARFFQDS